MKNAGRLSLLMVLYMLCSCSHKMYLENWGYVTDRRTKLELNEYEISVKGDTIAKGKIKTKFIIYYNREGFPVGLWEFLHYKEAKIKNTITYDKKARTVTFASYRKDTILSYKIVSTFNRRGQEILVENFDSHNTKTSTRKHIFTANRTDFNSYTYDKDGSLEHQAFTHKNRKGQTLKTIDYNNDGSISSYCTLNYDKRGNETEAGCYNPDGTLQFITLNKVYDKWGNLLSFEDQPNHTSYNKVIRNGNTTQIIGLRDGKPISLEEHIITY
jgi:hypothetical protein